MTSRFEAINAVHILTGIRVPMRDGVELNVRITRPDIAGRFPAVMEYHPYRRLAAALPNYRDEYPPVVPYLAEHGYVIVQYDVRGTGSSSGFSTDIYSPEERQDAYDMVAWIADQPWCTGAVGMIGKSYGAVVQWQVAVQRPPALKAIVVRSANDDVYTEFTNPGGCIRPWMFENYAPLMNALNFSPPDPAMVGDRFAAIWAERLEHSAPWSLGYIRNTLHGPYWRDQSLAPGYDRVQCAVLLIEGWADWYTTAELRAFQRLSAPRKVLIGPWGHYYAEEKEAFPGPRIDTRREYLQVVRPLAERHRQRRDGRTADYGVRAILAGAGVVVSGGCRRVAQRSCVAADASATNPDVSRRWWPACDNRADRCGHKQLRFSSFCRHHQWAPRPWVHDTLGNADRSAAGRGVFGAVHH